VSPSKILDEQPSGIVPRVKNGGGLRLGRMFFATDERDRHWMRAHANIATNAQSGNLIDV